MIRKLRAQLLLLIACSPLLVASAQAVTFDWVEVGNIGNVNDVHGDIFRDGYGGVDYQYRIAAHEVTNAQYVEFLNDVAASDPYSLYNQHMDTTTWGGITRSGSPGSFTYSVKPDAIGLGPGGTNYTYASKPVVYVSWLDAIRFVNWMTSGTTESGVYTITNPGPEQGWVLSLPDHSTLGPGSYFLPTEDEWYKAAYYDGDSDTYFDYTIGTDATPNNNLPSADTGNSANFKHSSGSFATGNRDYPMTDVGAYSLSKSPYGTYDQGGNVEELHEARVPNKSASGGGSWSNQEQRLSASSGRGDDSFPYVSNEAMGFRIASTLVANSPANGSFDSLFDSDVLNLDFGSILAEETVASIVFEVANLTQSGAPAELVLAALTSNEDSDILTTDFVWPSGLPGGESRTFNAFIETSTPGSYAASYDLTFTDSLGSVQTLTLNLQGEVVLPGLPSNASFATEFDQDVLSIDFGKIPHENASSPISFEIANFLSSGPAAHLDFVSVTGTGDSDNYATDLTSFENLAAGNSLHFMASLVDSSLPGVFDASYELTFTDILGADQTLTLNLSGEVVLIDDSAAPNLIYDAATGEVTLDPDGSSIIGYTLQNASDSFLAGNFSSVLAGVSTALPSELSEAALSPGFGSIGLVFPTGMNITELFTLLDVNQVSTGLGAPLVPFDLVVIGDTPAVPEPSTYAMAMFGLLGFTLYRWRRKR